MVRLCNAHGLACLLFLAIITLAFPHRAFAQALKPVTDNEAPPYLGVWEPLWVGPGPTDEFGNWLNRKALWSVLGQTMAIQTRGVAVWPDYHHEDYAKMGKYVISEDWTKWVEAVPGRRVVIVWPMLLSDTVKGFDETLDKGAQGAYNDHWTNLAKFLVSRNLGNSIMCMGHFNMDVPWKIQNAADAANFIKTWQQIVTTMRAVPGAEKLQFDWFGFDEKTSYPLESVYPGDAYVDYVGAMLIDRTFDKSIYPIPANATEGEILDRRKKAWASYCSPAENGLDAWKAIAQAHKKPLTIPLWGLFTDHYADGTLSTGGDNTYFIQQMYNYIQDPANNVCFSCYLDRFPGATKLSPSQQYPAAYPKSAELFHQLWGIPTK
jgi:hypothetical protein